MPSTMIHILTAFNHDADCHDLFWVGSFAPDYTDVRELKDKIHLRDTPDRWAALTRLRDSIDMQSPFEEGWLLHLFADTVWDETMIPRYERWFKETRGTSTERGAGEWFGGYRDEIAHAGFFMYHHTPWATRIWEKISFADLSSLQTPLPITREQAERYRERKVLKHIESCNNSLPEFFTRQMLEDFAKNTAAMYREWLRQC